MKFRLERFPETRKVKVYGNGEFLAEETLSYREWVNFFGEDPGEGTIMRESFSPLIDPKIYFKEQDDEDEEMEGDEEDEMLDTEPDDGTIPEVFLFESRLIFISNLLEIPDAVGDRCIAISLIYNKTQALDLIESKLEHLMPEYPELDLTTKKKIIAFLRKYKKMAKRITFRLFTKTATIYMSGDPDWEKWALLQLRTSV